MAAHWPPRASGARADAFVHLRLAQTVTCKRMATLRYFSAEGSPKLLPVHKPLMVIGRGSGNDVSVTGEGVLEHHAQIVFNGRDFQIEELDREAEISINGKRKRRARLVNGDRIKLGSAELSFS